MKTNFVNNGIEALVLTLPSSIKLRIVLLLIFLYPMLTATVKDAGSTIFLILFLLSLTECRNTWNQLSNPEQKVLFGIISFVVAAALSLTMTEDIKEGANNLSRYFRLVVFIPVYLMLRKTDLVTGKAFVYGAMLACFVMAGQALYQHETIANGVVHGAYHKIVFGDMAILFCALSFAFYVVFKPANQKYIFFIAVVLAGGYASILSQSRAAWLFVPIFSIGLLVLYWKRIAKRTWLIISIALALLFIILIFQPNKIIDGFSGGMNDIQQYRQNASVMTSWGSRLNMWQNCIEVFKTSPFIGTGLGDYQFETTELLKKGIGYRDGHAEYSKNAHSIYFQILAEGGVVGIGIFIISLIVFPLGYFGAYWRKQRDKDIEFYSLAGTILIVAYAWFGVSANWLEQNTFVNTFCFMLVVYMTSISNKIDRAT